MNKTTDEIVLDLLNKVEQKKKEIGASERPNWITNCSFGINPSNAAERINIQVADTNTLITIYANLSLSHSSFEQAAKDLGVKAEFKWQGFTFGDWAADIKTRLNQLQIKTKKDDLAKLEARVNALVSPEQRREMELKKLAAELQ